jgi:hypothetical protein
MLPGYTGEERRKMQDGRHSDNGGQVAGNLETKRDSGKDDRLP